MSRTRTVFCPGLGRPVEIPARPSRVVSLSPSLTDTVFRLGLGDLLVGRSAWCHRPPGVERLPVVGSYTSLRRDRLEALAPDLVLVVSGVQEELTRRLADEGVAVYQLPLPVSPWGIVETVAVTATVLGRVEAADGPVLQLHRALIDLAGVLPPLATYVEIDLGGPITAGAGSYVSWALRWLGLRPVTGGDPRAYFEPDDDDIARARPELVIYDPQPGRGVTPDEVRARFAARGLNRLLDPPTRLVVTAGDVIAHPGPWLIESGLRRLADRIRNPDAGPASV